MMTKFHTTKIYRLGFSGVLISIALAIPFSLSFAEANGTFFDFGRFSESDGPTFAQVAILKASDGDGNDYFGESVALDGNTAVVGAYEKNPGAGYVFVKSGASWVEQQKLPYSPFSQVNEFGDSVSISGDTVVVGAPFEHLPGCGGDPGAVYVFVRSGVTWTQQQMIVHPVPCNKTGLKVSVYGNTLVIRGRGVGSNSAVFVYIRNGTAWTLQQQLVGSDSGIGGFGSSLSIYENTLLVGAPQVAVNGQTDQGAAYVFVRNGTVWTEQQKLTAGDGTAGDRFGSVSLRGMTAIVGAPGSNTLTGAAYIFSRVGSTWSQEQKLTPSDSNSLDRWGGSVGIYGNRAVLGGAGVNSNTGAAYIFEKTGGVWAQRQKLVASDGITSDDFGLSVAISGDNILIGAPDVDNDRGAAYVFRLNRPPADFNGDGKTDVSVFTPSSGQWFSADMESEGPFAQLGSGSDKLVPGDYTGDGVTDAAIWRPSTGEWFVVRSENGTSYSVQFGLSGDIPVVGDFDSDSKTDLAVFRPSDSTWYTSKSSGGTVAQGWGVSGDIPVAADYDGDAKTDIAIFRPSKGQWWILRSSTGTSTTLTWGLSSDKLVPGDYTGDNKADAAVWRPSTGVWYILRSEDGTFYTYSLGASTDKPVPGDYDGDGRFDGADFQPSSQTWSFNLTTGGTASQIFGELGDLAIPNSFVP